MRRGPASLALIAFTLVGAGCHRAVPGRDNVAVNTGVAGFFDDTVGANSPAPPQGSQTFNLQSPGQRDSLHAEIEKHRERWRAGGAREYRFLLRASCFCPGQQGWLLLEIHDGRVVRIRDKGGNAVRINQDNNYTMDGLFDLLDQEADRDDVVAVGFDDRWHYPAYIRTDVRLGLPDDWGILQVRGFRPR